jgi:hypothetical protein
MRAILPLALFLTVLQLSCRHTERPAGESAPDTGSAAPAESLVNIRPGKKILEENLTFIADSLLKGHSAIVRNYIQRYGVDTCSIFTYDNKDLKAGFEGLASVNDINGNGRADSVFVMPPFNSCENGESYCFTDSSLPRLQTDSECFSPETFLW